MTMMIYVYIRFSFDIGSPSTYVCAAELGVRLHTHAFNHIFMTPIIYIYVVVFFDTFMCGRT